MRTKYLLPHRYLAIGWVLFLAGLLFIILAAFRGEDAIPVGWEISVPWPFEDNDSVFSPSVKNGYILLDIADELLDLAIITGLLMIAFSVRKLKMKE